jgi:branched-chain amino acid aminotransferase
MEHTMRAYVAGRFVEADQATVPLTDASLLQGVGLYETLRTRGGRPVFLADHLARLRRSAAYLRLRLPKSDREVSRIVRDLLRANRLPEARLRITVTAGPAEHLESADPSPAVLLVTAVPLKPYAPALYRKGAAVVTARARANEFDPSTRHKTTSRARHALARRLARAAGAAEALFLNTQGRVAEGAGSNVFAVRGGRVITPPPAEGLLPGITRQALMRMEADAGRPVEERPMEPAELLAADEVFLTNAIMDVLPVATVDGHRIGQACPGPVTRRLMRAYGRLVASETRGGPSSKK